MYKNSIQRFREIVKVLASYGFGYIVNSKINKNESSPENLRKAFEELGPTFIKIGQILSTRPDIISAPYIEELSKLQDNVVPEDYKAIKKVFFSEFLIPIEDAFLSFDRVPLASASIAQAHCAKLKNGKEVIVKIQRPDIYEKMNMDISILYRIIRLTKVKFSDAIIDPEEALSEILASTELELNFKNEANNIKTFSELNKDVAFICTPSVIEDFTSRRVLTMEKIDGFKINDMKKLEAGGYDLNDLGRKLALFYFKQVFEDGFFHGDPHPGNLLIKEGKICFIDFGIMGHLSDSLRSSLNEAIIAAAYKDPSRLIPVLMSIGIKKGYINKNKLYEDIEYLFDSYLSTSLENIKMSVMLQEIFDAAKKNNISFPKDLTILVRGLIIVEGVVAKIAPEIQILDIAIPFVKNNNMLSLLDDISFDELLLRSYKFIKDSSKIPSKLIELSNSILGGRAKAQLEVKGLDNSLNELNKMTNRLVFGLVASSLIIGSSLILNSNIGPKIYGISIIGISGFIMAAFMGLSLLISILKSGRM